jgi:hypothetical protein
MVAETGVVAEAEKETARERGKFISRAFLTLAQKSGHREGGRFFCAPSMGALLEVQVLP